MPPIAKIISRLCVVWFFASFLPAAPSFAGSDTKIPLEPLVYTGVLHSTGSERSMFARMFFIPGGTNGAFEAHMVLYHAGFDSREIVPIIFDKVDRQTDETYLLSTSRMTGSGMPIRSPAAEISVPGGEILEGVFHSSVQTRVGILSLVKGWELAPNAMAGRRIVPDFEGRYYGDCLSGPYSDMLTGIELYSTRSRIEDILLMPATDTSVEANIYKGGTICRDPDGFGANEDQSCEGFWSGHYDHYTGKLNLFMSAAWKWSCDVDEVNDVLTCDIPRFRRQCELYRIRDRKAAPADTVGKEPFGVGDSNPQMVRINSDLRNNVPKPEADSAKGTCSDLRKKIPGILHHTYTGLYQHVSLDLVTIEAQPGTCKISGMIAQYFNKSVDKSNIPITHIMESMVYDLNEEVLRVSSGPLGDALLILKREGLNLSGYWYSRLFGLVGRVEFGEGISHAEIPAEAFVPSIAGQYDAPPQNNIRIRRTLNLAANTDGSDVRSFNPIRQLVTTGLLKTEVISPDGDGYGLQSEQEVVRMVYDYFTGRVSFETSAAQFYGPVLLRGIDLRMVTTNNGARFIPFGVRWDFQRTAIP